MALSIKDRVRLLLQRLRIRRKEPESPEDPYAYVTAPRKPRPWGRSAAAVMERPEE